MQRRRFLGAATASVSAGLWSGETSASPAATRQLTRRLPLRLGTVTYNLGRSWDLETLIRNCAETGFEGVELRSTHAHGVEIDISPEKRREVMMRFQDSPVRLVGLGSACEYHSPDPEVLRRNIEETKAFVRLAHDVGAPGVKVRPNALPEGVPEQKTLEQIGLALRECGAYGNGWGVQIRMEVHGRETGRIPRIRKMLDYADHDNVRICWNSNKTDLLDGGVETNFNRIKDRISIVHMRDLFDEEYPWRLLFRLLREMEYPGYCLAEIPESTDPIRVMRYYRTLFRAFQDLV